MIPAFPFTHQFGHAFESDIFSLIHKISNGRENRFLNVSSDLHACVHTHSNNIQRVREKRGEKKERILKKYIMKMSLLGSLNSSLN